MNLEKQASIQASKVIVARNSGIQNGRLSAKREKRCHLLIFFFLGTQDSAIATNKLY